MGRLRVNHATAWFGILAFLLATLGSVDGKILCIGDDGHVALETTDSHASYQSTAISAMDDFPSGEREAAGVASCCTHCGPCTDFPARSVDLLRTFARFSPEVHPVHQLPIAPIALASLAEPPPRDAAPFPASQIATRPDPTAVSLRSTVLLI